MQRYIKFFFLLIFILIIIFSFCFFYPKEETNYFDTIDATTVVDDTIFSVGRNNDNDEKLTKAKFTVYKNKQEKTYEKIYNTGYTSRFYDLLVDNEDDIVIVGGYEQNKKDYEANDSTAVIVKYSRDGQLLFEKNILHATFYDVLSLSDGYLAIGSIKNKNKMNGIIYKYHRDGTLDWKVQYDENDTKFLSGVFFENQIYIVGVQDNKGVLISFSKTGKLLDSTTNNDIDTHGFSSITVVDDSLVLTAGKKVSDDFSQPMLVKYDTSLNYVDSVSYKTEYSGRFFKVITDSNNDLVVLGSSVDKTKNKNIHHAYIGKYRTDLTKASVIPYYNVEDDYFTDISLLDDTYLVSGYSFYPEQGYLGKFLSYSEALKILEVK